MESVIIVSHFPAVLLSCRTNRWCINAFRVYRYVLAETMPKIVKKMTVPHTKTTKLRIVPKSSDKLAKSSPKPVEVRRFTGIHSTPKQPISIAEADTDEFAAYMEFAEITNLDELENEMNLLDKVEFHMAREEKQKYRVVDATKDGKSKFELTMSDANSNSSINFEMTEMDMVSESEQTHSGDDDRKQFACRHCGKRYRWKSTLRRHETVECGGKAPSYSCPYCDYKAKQRGNLGVHVRKHHPELPELASSRIRSKDD